MIKAENITKSYNNGKIEVLKDISLEIKDGEFVVILGPSGSGKSTLMNILSGLEKADEGKLIVNNENLSEKTDKELTQFRKETTAFIFQQYYLLPHLNVENNVKLGASLIGNKDYKEIITSLGIESKLHSMPFELSGGEQQRVCIARALAKKPKILFLDEPTGALDEKTGREVLNYIMEEKKKYGFTMVMVTHNPSISLMAETIIKMNSGRIVETIKNKKQMSAYEIGW
ncbi:MAG TPA: ABC transporter ATP-binding protein [Firmicutes bacterium]|nr:ABC transporter ATP-binding protein [Bacillota bacterium]